MPLNIIRGDITKFKCDAIVNAANESLLGGGGVDGAIHAAAGPRLLKECIKLNGCKTGEAKITKGYDLPADFVIHTVGPVYRDGNHGEEELLRSCYRNSLLIAKKKRLKSIAFPLVSAGVYGYPKSEALNIAVDEIKRFLDGYDIEATIVVFDKCSFALSKDKFGDIESFIDDKYAEKNEEYFGRSKRFFDSDDALSFPEPLFDTSISVEADYAPVPCASVHASKIPTFELDESFTDMLLRLIDEKGISDADCYKKANIDRKHFSKIRSNRSYKPTKSTALAFAVALELNLNQTEELLRKAGFALSDSFLFDVIVKYYIENGIYDIFVINQVLFSKDQKLLGIQ